MGGALNSSKPEDANIIAPFNYNLEAGTGGAEYKIAVTGAAPNRICVVQFKNVKDKGYNCQFNNMNFQIRLFETSNVIEFVYGNFQQSLFMETNKSASIGLKGSNYYDGQLFTITKAWASDFSKVTPSNANYNTIAFEFCKSNRIVSGTTYRFVPVYDYNAKVTEIYCLRTAAIPVCNPLEIKTNIKNNGRNVLLNTKVKLYINNILTETKTVASLPANDSVYVSFNPVPLNSMVCRNIKVHIENINDQYIGDNTKEITQCPTRNQLSYASGHTIQSVLPVPRRTSLIYAAKHRINERAKIEAAYVQIGNQINMVDVSIYGVVMDANQNILAVTEDYTIRPEDYGYPSCEVPIAEKHFFCITEFWCREVKIG